MKATATTKEFSDALNRIANLPGANGPAIHTHGVRFEAGMNGLTLSRFTSEARVSLTIENVEVEDDEGTFIVGHAALKTMLTHVPGKTTVISNDEKHLHLVNGSSKGKLSLFGDDIAEPPEAEEGAKSIRLAIDDLRALFAFPALAVSYDHAARPHLCGVCIRMIGDRLAFIGTDGRRCHISLTDYKLNVDVTIPSAGVETILNVLQGETGACDLAIGKNTVAITGSNVEVGLSLLNEKFPNVEPLMNQPESSILSKITANRAELVEALKACAVIAKGDAKLVTWEFTEDALEITAANDSAERSFSIECFATAPGKIGVPAIQLATALEKTATADNENVELLNYVGSLFIRQEDKVAFVALSKTA